jgi:hypothetical protein
MSKTKIDKYNVPVLSSEELELKAEGVISYFNPQLLKFPQSTPLMDFIERLHMNKKFNLKRDYSKTLGKTKYGNIILGKTQLRPLGLFIDVSLKKDSRFNFVLGHEFGHIVLHRKVDVKASGYEDQEIVDTEMDMVTGKKLLCTPRDW